MDGCFTNRLKMFLIQYSYRPNDVLLVKIRDGKREVTREPIHNVRTKVNKLM